MTSRSPISCKPSGACATFFSNNPRKPLGHHWDKLGVGKSDYDIDIYSPELAVALLANPISAANEEILDAEGRVYFRNGGKAGFYQLFPQFEAIVRSWEGKLARGIDLRLRLSVIPIAQLLKQPLDDAERILLLWRA